MLSITLVDDRADLVPKGGTFPRSPYPVKEKIASEEYNDKTIFHVLNNISRGFAGGGEISFVRERYAHKILVIIGSIIDSKVDES